MRLFSLVFLVVLAAGCRPTVYFETDVKGSSTVPGSPLGGLLSQFPGMDAFTSMDVSQTQDFKNQGVTKRDVDSVKVKRFTLRISSPQSADFDWLSTVRFSVEASGQPKQLIASRSDIDKLGLSAPNPVVELELAPAELKPYVTADLMSITAEAGARAPPSDTVLEATVRLGVDAVVLR